MELVEVHQLDNLILFLHRLRERTALLRMSKARALADPASALALGKTCTGSPPAASRYAVWRLHRTMVQAAPTHTRPASVADASPATATATAAATVVGVEARPSKHARGASTLTLASSAIASQS